MDTLIFKIFKDERKHHWKPRGILDVLIPSTDNVSFGPNTKIYQDHIVCSYG